MSCWCDALYYMGYLTVIDKRQLQQLNTDRQASKSEHHGRLIMYLLITIRSPGLTRKVNYKIRKFSEKLDDN